MKILVTGSSGFIGRHLVERLANDGHSVIATRRRDGPDLSSPLIQVGAVGDIGPGTEWRPYLNEVDAVVHLAGIAHRIHAKHREYEREVDLVNHLGTRRLVEQAVESDVTKLVFLSSLKVMGDENPAERPFYATDAVEPPSEPYALSKYRAERVVMKYPELRPTIIRPPLVYGPGVGANFARLVSLIDTGVPLPFGSISNRRSLVSIRNLNDLILVALKNPQTSGPFLVSDGHDVSTPQLIQLIGASLQRPVRLVPMPSRLLRAFACLSGQSGMYDRLATTLTCDIRHTTASYGWSVPHKIEGEIDLAVKSLTGMGG